VELGLQRDYLLGKRRGGVTPLAGYPGGLRPFAVFSESESRARGQRGMENGREILSIRWPAPTTPGHSSQSSYVSGRATSSRLLRSAATPQHHWMIPAPIIRADPNR
jgi:hypothetical protein